MAAVLIADEHHAGTHTGRREGSGVMACTAGHQAKTDTARAGCSDQPILYGRVHRRDGRARICAKLDPDPVFSFHACDQVVQPGAD